MVPARNQGLSLSWRVVMDAIAGYADEDEEEASELTLDIGGGQEITSAAWCALLEEQADESWKPALDDQSWVATMKANEVGWRSTTA